jgi:urease gamma subunit
MLAHPDGVSTCTAEIVEYVEAGRTVGDLYRDGVRLVLAAPAAP